MRRYFTKLVLTTMAIGDSPCSWCPERSLYTHDQLCSITTMDQFQPNSGIDRKYVTLMQQHDVVAKRLFLARRQLSRRQKKLNSMRDVISVT